MKPKFRMVYATLVSCGLAVVVLNTACESTPKPAAEAVKSAEPPAPPPPPPPPPAPEEAKSPAPAAPKRKAEDCPKGANVEFAQKELEDEVRRKLQKPNGSISRAELKKVRSLNLANVKNLSELDICIFPAFTGLKELFLGPGSYDDLSPIAGATTLESLRASLSQVADLKPLAKLKKLDRLDLGHTKVKDLSPLTELSVLTELQLDDTPVEDLAPLAQLTKLESLSIQRTRVKDLAPLAGLKKLKTLYSTGTPADEDPSSYSKVRANGTKVIVR